MCERSLTQSCRGFNLQPILFQIQGLHRKDVVIGAIGFLSSGQRTGLFAQARSAKCGRRPVSSKVRTVDCAIDARKPRPLRLVAQSSRTFVKPLPQLPITVSWGAKRDHLRATTVAVDTGSGSATI